MYRVVGEERVNTKVGSQGLCDGVVVVEVDTEVRLSSKHWFSSNVVDRISN